MGVWYFTADEASLLLSSSCVGCGLLRFIAFYCIGRERKFESTSNQRLMLRDCGG